MNRDLEPHLKPAVAIAADVLAADNTPVAVDLIGYHAALVLLAIGVGGITFDGSNKVEFKLTHADADDVYSAVTDADVVLGQGCDASVGTGGIVKSLIAAHAAADVTVIGYRGSKRKLKLLADFSGTHGTGTGISAVVVKGHAENEGTLGNR